MRICIKDLSDKLQTRKSPMWLILKQFFKITIRNPSLLRSKRKIWIAFKVLKFNNVIFNNLNFYFKKCKLKINWIRCQKISRINCRRVNWLNGQLLGKQIIIFGTNWFTKSSKIRSFCCTRSSSRVLWIAQLE